MAPYDYIIRPPDGIGLQTAKATLLKSGQLFILIALKPGDRDFTIAVTDSPITWRSVRNQGVDPAFHMQIFYVDPGLYSSIAEAAARRDELRSLPRESILGLIKAQNPELKPIAPPRAEY